MARVVTVKRRPMGSGAQRSKYVLHTQEAGGTAVRKPFGYLVINNLEYTDHTAGEKTVIDAATITGIMAVTEFDTDTEI
jgi:hypothetical protein